MKAAARETQLEQVLESGRGRGKTKPNQQTTKTPPKKQHKTQGRSVQDTGARVSSAEKGERGPAFIQNWEAATEMSKFNSSK